MPIGDGIRRNVATITLEERNRLRDALRRLDDALDPSVLYPDGVTFWDKQEQVHVSAHVAGQDVHGGPAFLAWHRELVNRFEQLLRSVDPQLSLHYWDWTTDPRATPDGQGGTVNLFTSDFMGSANGDAGTPFADFESSEGGGHPLIWRDLPAGGPTVTGNLNTVRASNATATDSDIIHSADALPQSQQFTAFDAVLQGAHNYIHSGYIRGTIAQPHFSFHDPFVFLLHSNVDRLWAMWQRQQAQEWRLDPNAMYGDAGASPSVTSNMEPWSGGAGLRPWAPPESLSEPKTAKDLVANPPSYDTAPHSAYVIVDRDTFSEDEVQTLLGAGNATFGKALYVVYEGFRPQELGSPLTPPTLAVTFDSPAGAAVPGVSLIYRNVALEAPALDIPQRITFEFDVRFTTANAFSSVTELRRINLRATHGTIVTDALLTLLKQPNPYMHDGDVTWLSTDVRVFQMRAGWVRAGQTMGAGSDSNAPYAFIQNLLAAFNGLPNDDFHPFRDISEDQQTSALELSRSVGGQRVYNFAVAKVRYRASAVPATDVKVFFRAFSTMVSALDYNTGTNYRRGGNGPTAAPFLGMQGAEIASMPFFAGPRIDTSAASMTTQTDDTNRHTISAAPGESVWYFGCWLDINQTEPQFPLHPTGDGPFTNRLPIQQLVRGHHQCLVAEIHFHPGATDPIPAGATPGSSARLAQRNLSIVESDNPGGPDSHTVQHTFMAKPSSGRRVVEQVALASQLKTRPDELMLRWNNVPRDATATLYFPEITADEILSLASWRQRPETLGKLDDHTLKCRVTDVTYVPLPGGRSDATPVLLSIQLPQTITTGQVLTVDVHQFSGLARKMLGAFQITIPVSTGSLMLAREIRKLSVLKHVFAAIPTGDRWHPVFVRYLAEIEAKIRDIGGNPESIHPSPDGTGEPTVAEECCGARRWLLPAILALLVVLIAMAPIGVAPTVAAGIVALIAAVCWRRAKCPVGACDVLLDVSLGLATALFVLGGLIAFGPVTPRFLFVTSATAILNGVVVVTATLRGCWGRRCGLFSKR